MNITRRFILPVLTLLLVGLFLSPPAAEAITWRKSKTDPDIISLLERGGHHETLLFALRETGLDAVLSGDGSFTLFAPTDQAFAQIPSATLNALIADPAALTEVLLYHVLDGSQNSFDLLQQNVLETLQGNPILVQREALKLRVNNAPILSANRRASNGIVHTIGAVLLPPEEALVVESVVDVLKLDGRFSTLLTALSVTGLDIVLADTPDLTLLAPTDSAFAKLGDDTITALVADPATLSGILLYHVLDKNKSALSLLIEKNVTTLQGQDVTVRLYQKSLRINEAQVINPNIKTPNAVIHTLDSVLIPQ